MKYGAMRYREFVAEGKNQPALWENLKNQIFLGTDAFVQKMQSSVPVNNDLSEVPLGQRRAMPKSIEHTLLAVTTETRRLLWPAIAEDMD